MLPLENVRKHVSPPTRSLATAGKLFSSFSLFSKHNRVSKDSVSELQKKPNLWGFKRFGFRFELHSRSPTGRELLLRSPGRNQEITTIAITNKMILIISRYVIPTYTSWLTYVLHGCPRKDPRTSSISRNIVNSPSELCGRRGGMFAEVAHLVPSGRGRRCVHAHIHICIYIYIYIYLFDAVDQSMAFQDA